MKIACTVVGLVALAGQALGQDHSNVREPMVVRLPMSAEELARTRAAGKPVELDPATGEQVVRTFRDRLPADWRTAAAPGGPSVDSFGNPILSEPAGWPGWSAREFAGFEARVRERLASLAAARAAGTATGELESALGGYLGEGVVRGLELDALVVLEDESVVTPAAAAAIIRTMHGYEQERYLASPDRYEASRYNGRIADLLASHGASLAEVTALDPGVFGERGAPSGCYNRYTFGGSYRYRINGTVIWQQNSLDDGFADVPIGWNTFRFYGCQGQSANQNSMVRVSTNGYLTFFQQGGGAQLGGVYLNDPIPTPGSVDGFATASWDDYWVAPDQSPEPDHVWYETVGAVGQRVFTASWQSVSRLGGSIEDLHWFQVRLYEETGAVALARDQSTNDTLDGATFGLERFNGLDGDCGPDCSNTIVDPWNVTYYYLPAPQTIEPPANDACENAIVVSDGQSDTRSFLLATPTPGLDCNDFSPDVWYSFTAPANGELTAETCGAALGNADTIMSVHDACGGPSSQCVDDTQGICGPDYSLDAAVRLPMTSGQTVLIRTGLLSGPALVDVTTRFHFRQGAESCSGAAPLAGTSGTVHGTLDGAGLDPQPSCTRLKNDLWYLISNPFGRVARLVVDTCGTNDSPAVDQGADTVLALHPRCGVDAVACSDDAGLACDAATRRDAAVLRLMAPGETLWIRLGQYGSDPAPGDFTMHYNLTECPADFNGDGFLDFFDYDDFVSCFQGGACPGGVDILADFNGDGFIDFFDYDDFVAMFESGC